MRLPSSSPYYARAVDDPSMSMSNLNILHSFACVALHYDFDSIISISNYEYEFTIRCDLQNLSDSIRTNTPYSKVDTNAQYVYQDTLL